ncbi:dual specificity protein phosphatase family protein [Zavarzinella formosa]|uniref:dual specificity protein phosphatase family protein n=1 Tax=Zavarzinella formosa TaxID=360055 RepID=UPI0002EEC5A3|nr:dual specificity protein phosphatase family protein [Zavarzinella formosa]
MKYSLVFLMLAAACGMATAVAWDVVGWGAGVGLYAAFSFGLLAMAYALAGPRLLFKRPTGRRSIFGWVLLGPYFLLNSASFGLYRLFSRESAYVRVAPNLFFGRRLSAREATATGWVNVLDLAGEFPAARPWRVLPGYRSMPLLDATAPSEADMRSAVAWIAEAIGTGPVYVHCALGHGRSACVVIGYLLLAGEVATVADGVRLLRSVRPAVRLHPAQARLLRRLEPPPKSDG